MEPKTVLLRVYLSQGEYNALKETIETRKIHYSSVSDMLRKVLYDYTEKIADIVVSNVVIETKVGEARAQLLQKEAIIEGLRNEIHNKVLEIDTLKNNLQIKIDQGKEKGDKRK